MAWRATQRLMPRSIAALDRRGRIWPPVADLDTTWLVPQRIASSTAHAARVAKLPGFFLIGAMKSGTTSIYRYLAQHPQLFLPNHKEPNYHWVGERGAGEIRTETARISTLTRAAYVDLFRGARPHQSVGEGSITYLVSPRAAARIAHECPDARFLLVLRDPADRAWSHFGFNRQRGNEPHTDFGRALDEESSRCDDEASGFPHGYLWHGRYDRHLEVWQKLFPRERFCIQLYEDVCEDLPSVLRRFFTFLEVDADFEPDTSTRYNVTGESRGAAIAWLLRRERVWTTVASRLPPRLSSIAGRALRRPRPSLLPEHRARVIEALRDDVTRLQDRIGRDLSRWLR